MLLTAVLVLIGQPAETADFSRITGVMFYWWLLKGVPIASLVLAATAGLEAGAAPELRFKGLLRLLGVLVATATVLALAAFALSGFSLPAKEEFSFIGYNLLFYLPALFYLVLSSFTLAYTAHSALAGVFLTVASFAAAAAALFGINYFQEHYFEIFPISVLILTTALAAFVCPVAALRLLPGRSISGARAALLLGVPVLLSVAWIPALHLRARNITTYAEFPYYTYYPAEPYILGDAMLVQKPYTGEVFMIDSSGKRTEVSRGSLFPRLKYLFPELDDNSAIATRGKDGALWLLQHPSSTTARLLKGGIEGFKEQAVIPFPGGYPIWLENSENPVLIRHTKEEGDFFACLPYGGDKIAWKKDSKRRPACSYGNKETAPAASPSAFIKGENLVYGKERWHLPGARDQESPLYGYHFKNWSAYFVPADGKNGRFTYFFRTGTEPQPAWPGHTHNGMWGLGYGSRIMPTIKGALWWRDWESNRFVYLIVNEEGKPLPPFRLASAMLAQAGDDRHTAVLRATGDTVWLNLAGKYMAKVSATKPEEFKLWKFPKPTLSKVRFSRDWSGSDYTLSVRAVNGGAMITAMTGVYLMDWDGGLKKLY